ncbi:MAG: septum formation initiator family protein [Endomicrobia bacterium]|nr:septum formation initiator family protein [Endomicrobiia bacterium]
MKRQEKKYVNKIGILVLVSLLLLIFYLRQQYIIIKLQNEISQLYEQISAEESLNKKLEVELQKYTDPEYLKKIAHKLNFVPISNDDVVIIE